MVPELKQNMSLYQLAYDYEKAWEQLAETGGELTDEIRQQLDSIDEDFEAKAERVALFVINQEQQAQAVQSEINRLEERKQHFLKKSKNLRTYLLEMLLKVGKKKIQGTLATISHQKNPPTVQIENVSIIPTKYLSGTIKLPWENMPAIYRKDAAITVDKVAIRDDIKAGATISGVELVSEESLRIK